MSKPAFPRVGSAEPHYFDEQDGMSLLEYYAGQALILGVYEAYKEAIPDAVDEIANDAFRIAEAMIKEAEKRK